MTKQRRHNSILEALEKDGRERVVSTRELAERLAVSEMTIRRDLHEMDLEGLVQRLHGGATLPHRSTVSAGQRGQIGILLTSSKDKYADPFFNAVLQGADRKLQESGYRTAYVFSFADVYTKEQARDLLQNYPVDGVILIGTHYSRSVEYLKENVRVLIGTNYSLGPEHDAILFDGATGIRTLVKHLAKLGRRRLGFITGYPDSREEGFLKGIKAHNLPDEPELRVRLVQGGFESWTPQIGQHGADMLMKQKNPPDAIVCASDRIAIGAMQWLDQNGFRVPEDIAVTGFDNISGSEFTIPPLTTVHVHKELIGTLAAERAIRCIENPDEVPLQIWTPTSVIIRKSCGAAPEENS
ncbi:MAG: DeoR/GlpR family transcriptional regulator [Chloroflexi bacterium]|nr:DeoR/GlpR family transcriptional regulator [Chloroflexota bacterium]